MRLSHYDQVIEAARNGSGVADRQVAAPDRRPARGPLVAPLGKAGAPIVGGFYLEVAASAEQDATEAFVKWVRSEARVADEQATPLVNGTTRRSSR